MKVGIVWENGVSKWMSQMFEPLKDVPGMDLTVFIGERNKFDTGLVTLNKKHMTHREEVINGIAGIFGLFNKVEKTRFKKMHFYLNTLNKHLDGFDMVICHDSSRSLYTLSLLKKFKGFKLVVSYLENIPYRQVFDEKTNYIKHKTYNDVDHFIPWCDTIRKVLLLEGVPEEKVTAIYTGLDLGLFRPEPRNNALLKENSIPEDFFTVLYIGKLVSWKGVHMLVYAARILKLKGYRKFCFMVAGRGAQLDNMKKIMREAGVQDHFRFMGFVPYQEMRKLYACADVFVLPSFPTMAWQEQFGMVLVEAMACARPVIASDSGSIPEIIGDAGLTFTPGDFFQLAEKIEMLMNNKAVCDELGREGRRRAEEKFDASRNSADFIGVFKKVLGE